jgi:23S rRNA (guanosine2251-2'-O)-methyltransferase
MERNGTVCGVRPVLEALATGRNVEKVLLRREAQGEGARAVRQAATQRGIPVQFVPGNRLDRITRAEHQGVIAFVSPIQEQDLDGVIAAAYEAGQEPLIVAVDGVTDVRNIGAIARSAECFGAHALLVPLGGSARLGPDAVKSSAGALMRLPVCRTRSLPRSLGRAMEHGLRVVALSEKGRDELTAVDLAGPLVLVLGAEDTGVSAPVLRTAEVLARIPMAGSIGSLNVSVAAGIALHAVHAARSAGRGSNG